MGQSKQAKQRTSPSSTGSGAGRQKTPSASANGVHARQKSSPPHSQKDSNGDDDDVGTSSPAQPPNFVLGGMLSSKLMLAFHLLLAIICGVLYRNHVFNLKENEVHFSHLSDMEREMSFRTEMGFYYSYYKSLTISPSFWQGVVDMTHDNQTEYPDTINALQRFNLYPEVFVGGLFRLFHLVFTDTLGFKTKVCWTVNRGQEFPPVESCEGVGDRMYFYIHTVYWMNGAMMSVFFLLAAYLSNSLVGGVITVSAFFFNQGECTRVQWTPSLRESFAYPICVLHFAVVCHLLKSCHGKTSSSSSKSSSSPPPSPLHVFSLTILTAVFILFWQFAQFSLLTQAFSVTFCFIMGFVRDDVFRVYIRSQSLGLGLALVFLFGNRMLLGSYLTVALVSMEALRHVRRLVVKNESVLRHDSVMWLLLAKAFLLFFATFNLLVSLVVKQDDDAHIAEILKAKFTDFQNFHTLMYTCAKEFDFMEMEVIRNTSLTLLFPVGALVAFIILCQLLTFLFTSLLRDMTFAGPEETAEGEEAAKENESSLAASISTNKPHNRRGKPAATASAADPQVFVSNASSPPPVAPPPELVFVLLQFIFYTILAVLIMRLKCFWTPMLCLLMGLLPSKKICPWQEVMTPNIQVGFFGFLLALTAVGGKRNLDIQLGIIGEYNNSPMEEMLEWVKASTPADAVFGGPMPTMASIKLIAHRPIVNHPHYEDAGLRDRTMKVYTVASRKPMPEIHGTIAAMSIDYVIIDNLWCTGSSSRGCTTSGIWDVVDEANRGKEPACKKMIENASAGLPYFKMLFQNNAYTILQVQPI